MMFEGVPFDVVEALADALDTALPPLASRLADAARAERLPLIAGFDAVVPLVKLYVNASDASVPIRRRLRERAELTAPAEVLDAPHIIGINARRDGPVGVKLYVQSRDEVELAALVAREIPFAGDLARSCVAERAGAGAVACWELSSADTARPRAFFVAAREGSDAAVTRVAEALPSFHAGAVRAALPFAPGAARFIGVSAHAPPIFTLYFRPRGASPIVTLEPVARFRAGADEVGVFLEPIEHAGRFYACTSRHAVSYRRREGAPARAIIDALMLWVTSRVRSAEASDEDPARTLTGPSGPPSPWHIVDD